MNRKAARNHPRCIPTPTTASCAQHSPVLVPHPLPQTPTCYQSPVVSWPELAMEPRPEAKEPGAHPHPSPGEAARPSHKEVCEHLELSVHCQPAGADGRPEPFPLLPRAPSTASQEGGAVEWVSSPRDEWFAVIYGLRLPIRPPF